MLKETVVLLESINNSLNEKINKDNMEINFKRRKFGFS